jgi:hypothetical protein
MADFDKTTITAGVPAFIKEEGTIISQTSDYIVFKTKKKRSSRKLVRYISFKKIISLHTKNDVTTVHYIEPNFNIEFRGIQLDKISSSNIPGFVTAKLGSGDMLVLNSAYFNAFTETSSTAT